MKPASFDYVRAEDRKEVLDVLRREGTEARILAGGQSLMPMLAMRLARPGVLVDVMGVPEFRILSDDAAGLTIGAGVRQAALGALPDLAQRHPMLAAALPWIGHAQTRSRGTVCGSVAHADPSAEIPLLLLALGGEVRLRSHRRARSLPAGEFFTGLMNTAKAENEMIDSVFIPAAKPGVGQAFREIGRRHGDYAIVACAAVADGAVLRLAVGGVADRPMMRSLPQPGDPTLEEALDAFAWDLGARDDLHATARYRRELVRRLGRATIEEAARCRA
ncbi:carbon monoxide dehydrogenase [Roseomonas sp. KE2513]|uniref:FAD binding domain-containing protein n=1 Tax=Roseomonas sp. KE2513 TaxID=2479202 RepID=UPI0018DF5070|nr:FAD binding domain-containing protein [Roseomonas sp. KE2513]MBI0536485.1 carbon monoxide dehydrogenase [Roseomonas sp. KE2513]